MPGNLTPPILSEAAEAGARSAGNDASADSPPLQPASPAHGSVLQQLSSLDQDLVEELQSLRQIQNDAPHSPLERKESQVSRERDLTVRLDQAQDIIEASRWAMVQLQKLEEQQRISLSLQQQHHQSEIRELQASLVSSQQDLERSQSDLHELRQRFVLLEEELDQKGSLLNDLGLELSTLQESEHESASRLQGLEEELKATRQELYGRLAELTAAQERCEELERQGQQSERESASRLQGLEEELKATRQELDGRVAELTAAQERCEELERQGQQSEHESASRLQGLEEELKATRQELDGRVAELTAVQERCEELERQGQQRERVSGSGLQGLEEGRQRAASPAAGVPDGDSALSDPETQRLQEELIVLRQMLEDLPGIFEHKFRQRLQPLLEQRDWLLHENTWLRAKLPASRPALPSSLASEPAALSQAASRLGLNQGVQALRLLGRSVRRLRGSVRSEVDRDPDDAGPPTAA